MSGQHTPGPWEIGGGKKGGIPFYVYCDNDLGTAVAATTFPNDMTGWPSATRLANARLIAAAPTMRDYVAKRAAIGDAEALQILEAIDGDA